MEGSESLKFDIPEFETTGLCWSLSTRDKNGKTAVKTELKLKEGGARSEIRVYKFTETQR